jgi:hypothetical protein
MKRSASSGLSSAINSQIDGRSSPASGATVNSGARTALPAAGLDLVDDLLVERPALAAVERLAPRCLTNPLQPYDDARSPCRRG